MATSLPLRGATADLEPVGAGRELGQHDLGHLDVADARQPLCEALEREGGLKAPILRDGAPNFK